MNDTDVNNLRYLVVTSPNPDELSLAVSDLLAQGWQLHGDLKLQAMADVSSPTFARLVYIQAVWREVVNA